MKMSTSKSSKAERISLLGGGARDEESGAEIHMPHEGAATAAESTSSRSSCAVAAVALTALALVGAAVVATTTTTTTTTGGLGMGSSLFARLGYGTSGAEVYTSSVPVLIVKEQPLVPIATAIPNKNGWHVSDDRRNAILAAAQDTLDVDSSSSTSTSTSVESNAVGEGNGGDDKVAAVAELGTPEDRNAAALDVSAEAQVAKRAEIVMHIGELSAATAPAASEEGPAATTTAAEQQQTKGSPAEAAMGQEPQEAVEGDIPGGEQQEGGEDTAAAEAAEEGEDASVAEVPDVDEGGQPTFAAPLSAEDEEFRRREFEADKVAEKSEDAKVTAEAYILDPEIKANPQEWSPDPKPEVQMGDAHNDLLAVAMRDDPVDNRYLPPIYRGFDMYADGWLHQPTTDRGGKNQYKVCIDQGVGSWDAAYAVGLDNLFKGGICFNEVTEGPCDEADVVIFNEGVVLWGGGHRNAEGAVAIPPKAHPNQVYIYYAHEAAGTFGWDLKDKNIMGQFDYIAYFDQSKSALWWPFGPTLRSMLQDFKFFARPREKRIPGVSWLAIDCLPLRTHILQEIGEHFPVFSIGYCMNNAQAPSGLPGRGAGDSQFQNLMSNYMFYFALENGGACPGYATEKVWLALTRGSVPLYFGTDDIYDQLPSPDAIIDLKKFNSPQQLADRLYAIATDPGAYWEVHKWRYQDPMTWNEGFRKLLRIMSTDIKYGVCHVLQKGASEYPKAQEQKPCDYNFKVMGKRVDSWPERSSVKAPTEHLSKNCERADAECWTFINPDAYNGGAAGGAAATAQAALGGSHAL